MKKMITLAAVAVGMSYLAYNQMYQTSATTQQMEQTASSDAATSIQLADAHEDKNLNATSTNNDQAPSTTTPAAPADQAPTTETPSTEQQDNAAPADNTQSNSSDDSTNSSDNGSSEQESN